MSREKVPHASRGDNFLDFFFFFLKKKAYYLFIYFFLFFFMYVSYQKKDGRATCSSKEGWAGYPLILLLV